MGQPDKDTQADTPAVRGGCLCGAVTFALTPPLRRVVACHCTACRKQSGHFWAATSVPSAAFRLQNAAGLVWIAISAKARRGFCRDCGSFLFWAPAGEERISVAAGALASPSGVDLVTHIFTQEAGDYYAPEGPPPATAQGPDLLRGTCLCGANRFALPGPAGGIWACHCGQCRRYSGHYAASFEADEAALDWQARDTAEFTTPGGAQRGFCPGCGSGLYFRAPDGSFSIEAGVIDGPTGARLESHIFVADKGDYYAITDGLPQFRQRE